MIGVPVGLLTLLRYVFDSQVATFEHIGAPMCGLFPFTLMFLITSIAMLRERTSGTLERLMSLPLTKAALLGGYAIAFGVLAAIQAAIVCTVGFTWLGLNATHGAWLVGFLAVGNALLGMALGLFASAFARTEFQAVQFMPAIVFPQLLLCGLFVPRGAMAAPLRYTRRRVPAHLRLRRAQPGDPPGAADWEVRARRRRRDRRDTRRPGARRGDVAPPDTVGSRITALGFSPMRNGPTGVKVKQ